MMRSIRAVRSVAAALPLAPVAVPMVSFSAVAGSLDQAALKKLLQKPTRIIPQVMINDKPSDLAEAIKIVKAFDMSPVDQTIALALDLNVDPRKPNQMVRGMANVPHSSGKNVVICVFASGEQAAIAREAGADIIGDDETIAQILSGKIEFNRCLATPDQMRHLAKVARVLGPRGLMPNPKMGTVTQDMKTAVASARQGQIQYKCDRRGTLNVAIGKASWEDKKIIENITSFVEQLIEAKPSGAKGTFFNGVTLSSTRGFGKALDVKLAPFRVSN